MSYYYSSNNALAMYIDGSGAIGFGTSNTSNVPGYVTFSNPINVLSGIQNPNASYTGNISDGPAMPSFTWNDTSNYGMFRASNSVIGFSTSSTEAMRIDNYGRIGISKSNPQFLLDVSGAINAIGYCNLLSNVINSTSVYTAPTNNALYTVNLQSIWGCNLAVNISNIVFNPSSNPNNVQGNYTCNLTITNSNQLYPIAIYSSNYLNSNTVTFSNMILNCNLNVTSLCNFGTSYFASNVVINNTLSNIGNVYFASNLSLFSLCNFGIGYFASNVVINNSLSNIGYAYFGSNLNINNNLIVNQNIVGYNTFSNSGNAYFGSNLRLGFNLLIGSNANGFIGINNLNPGAPLDVIANQDLVASFSNYGNPFLRLFGSNNVGGALCVVGISNVHMSNSIPGDIVLKSFSNNVSTGRLLLGTNTNPVLTISNASVGIGTLSPQNTLDVGGIINSYTGITNSGFQSNLGNISIGSNLNLSSNIVFSNLMYIYSTPGLISGTIGNSFRLRNLSTSNIETRFSVGNSIIGASNYSSMLYLYANGTLESSANTERFQIKADSNGANMQWLTTGTGSNRPIIVYNSNIYNPDGSVIHSNTLTTANLNIYNSSSNTLFINSKNSQSTFGQIIFTSTSSIGDLRITSDGGDLVWQGGGSRTLQMAAYHGITLMGGRTTGIPPTFVNGSGSQFNTAIQNTNNSIGLIVQGVSGQSSDLVQFINGGGTVMSRINSNGLHFDSNNNPPTRGNKINMLALSNSGSYTPSIGVNTIHAQIIGAGGAGGGATGNSSGAGGGGAGGMCINWITGISQATTYTYTIGTGGTGSTGNGSAGGNTSININGIIYMGIGGGGGLNINSGNSASLGGTGGGTSNGLIASYGESGYPGANGFYTVNSGSGGNTIYGQGGEGRLSAGPGLAGAGYGAGGGGAYRNTTSLAGGNGANGIIIIEEYT